MFFDRKKLQVWRAKPSEQQKAWHDQHRFVALGPYVLQYAADGTVWTVMDLKHRAAALRWVSGAAYLGEIPMIPVAEDLPDLRVVRSWLVSEPTKHRHAWAQVRRLLKIKIVD